MQPDDRRDGDVSTRIRDALMERPEVVFAYVFGSRAEGAERRSSDVDVAVYLQEQAVGRPGDGAGGRGSGKGRSLEAWSAIHGDVVRSVGTTGDRGGAPEGVDLVLLNRAPPLLADRVARSGKLLFSRDEPERIRWLVRTKSRYCDLRPLRERLDRTVQERIRSGQFGRGGAGRRSLIDPSVVRRRLRKLDELLQRLRRLAETPRAEFLADPVRQAAAERLLQVAVQVVLDLGAHVLSERGVVDWEEYREVPLRLEEEEVLPEGLAERLSDAAGQRNILVHLYLDVDPEQIFETLRQDLDAFSDFADRIERLL